MVQADALSVSSSAHFIAVARAHLAKIPDVRVDKVEALRAQLDSDSYSPDGEAVADGIVKDHTPQLTES
jgi:negative regulator of flagellin synthesis FlgM